MLKIKKIQNEKYNLDVHGEGCWSDCWVDGYWYHKKSTKTKGCGYRPGQYDSYKSIFK